MAECWIATGGNVGQVDQQIQTALDWLGDQPGIQLMASSSLFETVPMGAEAGAPFLNGAAGLETELSPEAVLDLLQEAEKRSARLRLQKWGPRTLDLDLLFYGSLILESPRLVIPHPHMWYRRFVLDPLAEIAPNVWHPVKEMTVAELRSRLLARPLPCLVAGGTAAARTQLIEKLAPMFPQVTFQVLERTDDAPGTFPLMLSLEGEPLVGKTSLPLIDLSGGGAVQRARDALGAALGI